MHDVAYTAAFKFYSREFLKHDCSTAHVDRTDWLQLTSEKRAFLCENAKKQELSYRQQIARKLRTQYAEGIYRHKYYTVTLKSRLRVKRRLSYGLWYNCSSFSFTVLQFCCRITSTDRSMQLQSPISAGRYVPFPRKFCFIYFITELSNINLDFWIISSFATNTTAFDKLGFNVSGLLGKRYGKLSGSFTTMAWLRQ